MSFYDHFAADEQPFVKRAMDWIQRSEDRYQTVRTDFLDPREQFILDSLVAKNEELRCETFGGYEEAERVRALLLPAYIKDDDFGLALFHLDYPKKFATVDHPQLLGSLIGLGIKREKIGDLLFVDDLIQFIVADEVADYVQLNLTRVGRTAVTCVREPMQRIIQPRLNWEQAAGTVASLRIDTIIAEIFRLSRAKASALVTGGTVKVNWRTVEKPAFEVKAGDHLSVRGFGRSRLVAIGAKTRRGSRHIEYEKLK